MAAKKPTLKFEELMKMKEDEFIDYVASIGKMPELDEISSRTTKQKVYPKVLKPMRKTKKKVEAGIYEEGKLTWQADRTKKPTIVEQPITFFEVKTAFGVEVLGMEKKKKQHKETFRDRIAKRAQNA